MHRVRLAVALTTLLTAALTTRGSATAPTTWFSAWSRPQSVAAASAADPLSGGRGPGPLQDQTVRDVVRLTGGGTSVRVELSNRYGAALRPDGSTPLHVEAATIAQRSTGASVVASTLRVLTFAGRSDTTITPGATTISDPILMTVAKGADLAISIHAELAPIAPAHGASFATSYLTAAESGDHTRDAEGASFTSTTASTLILTAVDVRSRRLRGVVATTGGSVTDGFGTAVDSHTDYPFWLARRLTTKTVVNNGLGGTTASSACAVPGAGPSVEARVAHDSLGLPGVTDLIVYAGTNDLMDGCSAAQIISAYRSILRQAHADGVKVLITTITPRGQYTKAQNLQRGRVNAWVRRDGTCFGECDRSLDFDAVVRDRRAPNRITPAWDSGDGVHPNAEGYRRIAASVPLAALGD